MNTKLIINILTLTNIYINFKFVLIVQQNNTTIILFR